MVGHLSVPSLDTTKNIATSLSKRVVTDLLKNELKFQGLVVTDALNMKGVSSYFEPGVVDAKALIAGNDMLLFTENVPNAVREINRAIDSALIDLQEIESRVRKILIAKYAVGLNHYTPIELESLYEDLNSNEAKIMSQKLFENAMTVLDNREGLIPLNNLQARNIAALSIGTDINNEFLKTCNFYADMQLFALKKDASLADFDYLLKNLEQYNTVIVGLHDMSRSEAKNFSISKQTRDFLNHIAQRSNVILVVFGNAYSLRNFENLAPILLAYEDNDYSRSAAAQVVFGGISATGTLPVSASWNYKAGDGFVINQPIRMKFGLAEEVGICSKCLLEVDQIMEKAIKEGATPGAQIFAAKDGVIFYNKSFGRTSYNESSPAVRNTDLYDLASLTKILSTNLMVMKMVEENHLELKKRVSSYLPYLKYGNKKNIRVSELLTHTAGLTPFIPYWKESLELSSEGIPYLSQDSSSLYPVKVAESLYLKNDFRAKIKFKNLGSELKEGGKYLYSDLSFYYLQELVEEYYDTTIDVLVQNNFYKTMGLSTMTFNPRQRFYKNQIVPTELDTVWRKQLLQGYVHDPGAALMGGVAGHAGLFANASDVAIIMQMLLNGGTYGGVEYLKPSTIQSFTKQYNEISRRGLGFDKPEKSGKSSNAAQSASAKAFGHVGFTGVSAWADPETGIVYVFLSNRVYPSAENKKLSEMNVRTDIHEVFYKALKH
jgi:beta-N-acetylhexosaminidase